MLVQLRGGFKDYLKGLLGYAVLYKGIYVFFFFVVLASILLEYGVSIGPKLSTAPPQ